MKSYKQTLNEKLKNDSKAHSIEGEELKELQKVLLSIYIDVQKVCEKKSLSCMLLSGSTLGAVRHKGFIPWDDDFDMALPREDFEKFKEIFENELGDKYILNAPNYHGKPTNRFAKVLKRGTKFVEIDSEDDDRACIKIDIFVLENIPNNRIARIIKGLRCTFLMFAGGHVLSYEEARIKKRKKNTRDMIGMLMSFRSSEQWFDRFDIVCRHHDNNSKDMGIPSSRKHYFGEILPRGAFLPTSEGSFEGVKIFLPADTDTYLRNLYGNYMEIPPEDKREKHYVERIEF